METLLARGQYATVRAEHKHLMARFTNGCEMVRSGIAYTLKSLQDDSLDRSAFSDMKEAIDELAELATSIQELSLELKALKVEAWR
jgi:hypothetical protein